MQRINKKQPRRASAGDTIVEVLIAITVVGSVLAAAFVTTNRNTLSTQDSQERSQALQIAQGQLEYLRSAGTTLNGHCFGVTGANVGTDQSGPNCVYSPNGAGTEPAYTISFAVDASTKTYTVNMKWASVVGSGDDTLSLSYRTGK